MYGTSLIRSTEAEQFPKKQNKKLGRSVNSKRTYGKALDQRDILLPTKARPKRMIRVARKFPKLSKDEIFPGGRNYLNQQSCVPDVLV
jgi:hypothetical protein